jgi:N-acetylmuramoyl-L-alanine amidase
MKFQKVFINPGHGGPDTGAVGNVLHAKESDVAMEIAWLLYEGRQWSNVLLSRWNGTGVVWNKQYVSEALERICRDANDWQADLFVSIHCNSDDTGTARGWEIWTTPGHTASDDIAAAVMTSVQSSFPSMTIRGAKESDFYVLKNTNMPAILIETGFISNQEDEALLVSSAFQQQMADAIYAGIESY